VIGLVDWMDVSNFLDENHKFGTHGCKLSKNVTTYEAAASFLHFIAMRSLFLTKHFWHDSE